ncbi:hypothetical protein RhiXN_09427 [Rhizoctonia solani]|uniref:DUF6533 domain-containing protein n=1 Tax=Rhizoctonia solani TaxID=456999 RepID=A0A8H8NXA3_9AGAM|nr:uncharacterized protein RhiXN_09427 [Rhizoctonia solani]QRW20452.1 hypothetical protein RhiXN_09427 [Rhizoctonia solani]
MASSPGLEYVTLAHHLLAAKYFMLASFVFMIYDHMITFAEEVLVHAPNLEPFNTCCLGDRVWQREWTGATWLFFLNRYLTELQFIVNLHFMIHIGLARCEDFIPFPGASTLISIAIAEIILILSYFLSKLTNHSALSKKPVDIGTPGVFWVGQVIVMGTVMRHPTRLRLPEGFGVFKEERGVM